MAYKSRVAVINDQMRVLGVGHHASPSSDESRLLFTIYASSDIQSRFTGNAIAAAQFADVLQIFAPDLRWSIADW